MMSKEVQGLETQWLHGDHSLTVAKQLVYLYWSSQVEPPWVTGIGHLPRRDRLLPHLLTSLQATGGASLEICLVLGYMAWFAPWAFGNEAEWTSQAQTSLQRAVELAEQHPSLTPADVALIRFYLDAVHGDQHNHPPPDNTGCFPDLFGGPSTYDHYFRWIFRGC